jgi:hypothetical protein
VQQSPYLERPLAIVPPPFNGYLGSPVPSTNANTSLIPGLSLGQQAVSVWLPQAQAVSTYADDSIYSLGHEDIATGPFVVSQHEASDVPFTNYVQTSVNFPAQQTFSQAPLGNFQSRKMFSCDQDALTSGDGFFDPNLGFHPQHSSQNLIQDVEDNDMTPMPMLPISDSVPIIVLAPPSVPSSCRFDCTYLTCNKTFKRNSDRVRHENSIHFSYPGVHLCPIIGCAKAQGKGFSRSDKVTEHLWKCHGNLGFQKRD